MVTKFGDEFNPKIGWIQFVKDPRFQPIKAIKFVPILRVFLRTWSRTYSETHLIHPSWALGWGRGSGHESKVEAEILGGGSWATRYSWWQPEIWPENQLRERDGLTQLHFNHARPTCRSAWLGVMGMKSWSFYFYDLKWLMNLFGK